MLDTISKIVITLMIVLAACTVLEMSMFDYLYYRNGVKKIIRTFEVLVAALFVLSLIMLVWSTESYPQSCSGNLLHFTNE